MTETAGSATMQRRWIAVVAVLVVVAVLLTGFAVMRSRSAGGLLPDDATGSRASAGNTGKQQTRQTTSAATPDAAINNRAPQDALNSPLAQTAPSARTTLDEADVRAIARGSFVRVRHARDGNVGCGVVVSSSRTGFDVITADHVVAEYDDFFLVTEPRESEPKGPREYRSCKTLLHDPVLDLAYVRVTAAEANVESLSLAEAVANSSSQTVDAWKLIFSDAGGVDIEPVTVGPRQVARRSAGSSAVSYWKLDRPLAAGLSGSALISPQGALLGVACGNSENVGYYCDERELRTFFGRAGLAADASK